MDYVTFIALVTFFHGALYFTDHLLRTCLNLPYLYFVENLGIKILPFQIHVFSTFFNRTITKCSYYRKKTFQAWFSIGAVIVLILLLPAIYLLLKNLLVQISGTVSQKQNLALQPLVPGYNLPYDEFPYYFFTLLVTSLYHELGHAVAAVGEDVHINGIGFVLLCVLPAAYVDLPTEGVQNLSPFQQLKVFCAGVWHNVVLVIFALGIGLSVPYVFSPLYKHDEGILVLQLDQNSPARGPTGLFPGDVVTHINFCRVITLSDWQSCLVENLPEQTGFCISQDIVNDNDETIQHSFAHRDGSIECCQQENTANMCFELRQDETKDTGESPMHPYSCLPARVAVTSSQSKCETSSQCLNEDHHCLMPSIRNNSRLLYITRHNVHQINGTPSKSVIFWGPPGHLYFSVSLTNYLPKYSFLPYGLPNAIEVICDYMIKFSGGLAILNLIPCFYLDGYRIFGALIDLLLAKHLHAPTRRILHMGITLLGSLLLGITLCVGIITMGK